MAPFNYERAAAALVEAAYFGDTAACARFDVARRSLERWRKRLATDDDLAARFEDMMERAGGLNAERIQLERVRAPRRDALAFRQAVQGDKEYKEADLQAAVIRQASVVCSTLGLPPVQYIEGEYQLPTRNRVDVLIQHTDGSYTIAEVKSYGSATQSSTGWLLYGTVGQLLYYLEVVADTFGVPAERINLAVFADYDPDIYYLRSLERVKHRIRFCNVLPLVLGAVGEVEQLELWGNSGAA